MGVGGNQGTLKKKKKIPNQVSLKKNPQSTMHI